ncbi:lytic transglycosylase domain-containing protein [Paenibacillus urinalis]|uniref:Lytic transglycosylase domain-containing protein n=1 Tax=Paenibacillus urinalis TaxID=521520 RepID=A0ABY7XHB7_9BACL|nr:MULTISPECIES: lytic transglycosylase domain-containing protein [Paenibacillus]WDH95730.1 lytic transglycosylase domain-containing protein [Paenibacillus urinalis]WDI03927.1 lytic transglycosylase domain-containing protein [Paenibacillus urinalis]GAK38725.1 lytic murein transglycosylase [Paenibacillus sp. TCA20]
MKLLRKKRSLLVLFIAFVLLLFLNTNWMSWFYPIHYKEQIRTHSENYEVDPFLVASIIRVESNYKLSRESKKGAIGLMQLMPDTANWILETARLDNVTLDELKHEPDANIQMGTWYLDYLSDHFEGNPIAAIAAYNAGQGNVGSWIKEGKWDGHLDTIGEIPIGETRHYVQRVVYYYNQYKDIYKEF